MQYERRPYALLLAGPNGAGKSTTWYQRLQNEYPNAKFLNADEYQANVLKDSSLEASYAAADAIRDQIDKLLSQETDNQTTRPSFAMETVFSHPSKLKLVRRCKDLGYFVIVVHIGLSSPDISVERVALRVLDGGHDIPENKIRERFERNKALIAEAISEADLGLVYDNSENGVPAKLELVVEHGNPAYIKYLHSAWVINQYQVQAPKNLAPLSDLLNGTE